MSAIDIVVLVVFLVVVGVLAVVVLAVGVVAERKKTSNKMV